MLCKKKITGKNELVQCEDELVKITELTKFKLKKLPGRCNVLKDYYIKPQKQADKSNLSIF